jgi:hypothetical protein
MRLWEVIAITVYLSSYNKIAAEMTCENDNVVVVNYSDLIDPSKNLLDEVAKAYGDDGLCNFHYFDMNYCIELTKLVCSII